MLVRGVPAREKNPNKSRKSKNSANWCMHAGTLPALDISISEIVVCFWDVFEVEARVIRRARRSSTWRAARALVRCHPSRGTTSVYCRELAGHLWLLQLICNMDFDCFHSILSVFSLGTCTKQVPESRYKLIVQYRNAIYMTRLR